METNFPEICKAVEFRDALFDASLYQGEYDPLVTYTKGQSVSVGNDVYMSKIDGNITEPPSVSWVTLSDDIKLSSDGDSIVKQNGRVIKNQMTAWADVTANATPPNIRDSYNVASITRTGTGQHAVTFLEPMDSEFYHVAPNTGESYAFATADAQTVNGFTIYVRRYDGSLVTDHDLSFSVIGGKI